MAFVLRPQQYDKMTYDGTNKDALGAWLDSLPGRGPHPYGLIENGTQLVIMNFNKPEDSYKYLPGSTIYVQLFPDNAPGFVLIPESSIPVDQLVPYESVYYTPNS